MVVSIWVWGMNLYSIDIVLLVHFFPSGISKYSTKLENSTELVLTVVSKYRKRNVDL
jgi:hypothetical protein